MGAANSFGAGPSSSGFAITPSDSVDLDYPVRAIYVGTGGDVKVLLVDDTVAITLKDVQTGAVYPIQAKKVYSTDTTASDLVGLR